MSSQHPRISLIHATPLSIQPIADSFKRLWSDAKIYNLLEDSLTDDLRGLSGDISAMAPRFVQLTQYALGSGADAVLFTCSAFGPAIETAKASVIAPVLKPNEAMIEEAVELGSRIALVATFEPALAPISVEFQAHAATLGRTLVLEPFLVNGAWDAIQHGDKERHDHLIVETCSKLSGFDVVCFAQFSMTTAQAQAQQATGRPTLSTPDSAVKKLMSVLGRT
ncbi:Asp/Glu/Hydantoin racemase [Caballeronia hypogeia]|uniref:Asp/Glu/Hydantoin racemase n=2 Tax=Caballeronia hypogeia TaxID=1777140 RepID=A0A158CC70_9BURK|nr:Asp/Glu/Hydantoin racemase [Caballeronia hypogeia]